MVNNLWGHAFDTPTEQKVIQFTAGRDVQIKQACDERLIPYDIKLNKAHAKMLAKQNIITNEDLKKLLEGLDEIEKLWQQGKFKLDPTKEDVHTNIESWLTEKYGIEVAGKVHTARSRNDQITTDMKMYIRDEVENFMAEMEILLKVLLNKSKEYKNNPMPGFTHHQHAMITTLGHTFHSFAQMLERDIKRLNQWKSLHNFSPLGNAASFGTMYEIDRESVAKELGFESADQNSSDAITNRWEFEADFAFSIAIAMNHLSQIAQTLIIFATPQFGFVKLSDAYSTGSSIMPQKKNPDPLEVIKAKSAYVHGQLQALMTIGTSNFIGYNRDSQWSKYIIMDVADECRSAFEITASVIETAIFDTQKMEQWCHKSFIAASSLMENLAANFDIPMRQAKMIVEKAVKNSNNTDKVEFEALKSAYQEILDKKPEFDQKFVEQCQDPSFVIAAYKSKGSPNSKAIVTQPLF